MTKQDQLKKVKKDNPKKLTKTQDLAFRKTIRGISNDRCQLCGEVGQDIHHPLYGCQGANRDMTCATLLCRDCHDKCHKDKHGELNTEAERIGRVNHREHTR